MRTVIHYITNIAPLYRKNLWKRFLKDGEFDITFFFGHGKNGIKEIDISSNEFDGFTENFMPIKNVWLNNGLLIWQKGLVSKCLKKKPDLVILLGEFAIISNWIVLLIYKLKNIPVVFYGHGLYGNEKGLKKILRKLYLKLGSAHLVYENHAKNMMINAGFNPKDIHVFYNSLDYDEQIKQRLSLVNGEDEIFNFFVNKNLPVIVFVGRLTKEKKLHYLITLANSLSAEIPVNLLFIGEGEIKDNLIEQAREQLTDGSYFFYGGCYDESILGKLLFYSDLCISPGNVGLTAIHAMTYGTPVATHANMFEQGPEVEAIQDGITGYFFEQHNLNDLILKTKKWLVKSKKRKDIIRQACFEVIDTKYNPDNQVKIFKNVVKNYRQ